MVNEVGVVLTAFLSSPEGIAIQALLVGAVLVFGLGVFAALRDGTFKWDYVSSFVRSTIWGRIAPLTFFLLIGYMTGNIAVSGPVIIAAAAVGAGLITSAIESLRQLTMDKVASAERNVAPEA